MIKHNQNGAVNGVVVALVAALVMLVGAIVFGAWAFGERQSYKNDVDKKIAVAVDAARIKESQRKDLLFAEQLKNPLRTYIGPEAFGSLKVAYPNTWSGYVDDSGSAGGTVEGYFGPGVVPAVTNQKSVFALRIKILSQSYAQTLQSFSGQQQTGKLKVSAYALPLLPKHVGVLVEGQLADQKTVTMVVVPLRSQTLQIWTEGTQYLADFNKYILPNFSFAP